LFHRHPFDRIVLCLKIFVEKSPGKTLVIGGGFNIYKLFRQCKRVNRHALSIRYPS